MHDQHTIPSNQPTIELLLVVDSCRDNANCDDCQKRVGECLSHLSKISFATKNL